MIKMIESKFESKAAKSTTKPCPHAPRLQIGCFHNCKCLRTQEDLFGLQTGNSLGKNVLFLFHRKVWPLPQRMRLGTEMSMVQACGYPACGYPRVYHCTPATQAAPLKDWRTREGGETAPAGTFKDIGEQKKTVEAQQIPTVARGPSVEGACRGCISGRIWSVKPLQLVGSGVLYGCFNVWSTALSWIRKFSFFYLRGFLGF